MRILVTGGAGFIGSYLVQALLQQGDEVVVFDCASEPHLLSQVRSYITYIQGDAASEIDVYRAVATNNIDGIFHLSAMMAGPCERTPLKAFAVNVRSTQILLDAAVTFRLQRFFLMSSISIYSPTQQEPVPEDAPKEPCTIYGQTKLANEHLMRWYTDNHGLDTRGIRPTWVWGPHRTNGITAQYTTGLVDSIVKGGIVHIHNPEERGDWIYVHDTVKAMLLIWNALNPAQRVYTVCGSVHTIREVAEKTHHYCPKTRIIYAETSQNTSPYAAVFDDSAIRTEFNYTPDYSIDDSIRDYIKTASKKDCFPATILQ